MENTGRLSVIGGGSWATALVKIFSESGFEIKWYLRSEEVVTFLKKEKRNPKYLTFVPINTHRVEPCANMKEAVAFSDTVLFAIPSAYVESTLLDLDAEDMKGKYAITSIKGIVPGVTQTPSEYIGARLQVPPERRMFLGGPCHAEEVALERKTFMTLAGREIEKTEAIVNRVNLDYVRALASNDPLGLEIAAIMKNIIGVASGIAKGLNYGDNFQAVLVSNALKEVALFLNGLDQRQRDLNRSCYFGDLLVTAYSEFSRNRSFGRMIGRGYSVGSAQNQQEMVAEGYYATKGIYDMAKSMNLELPIISMVYRILYNKISPYVEFKLLEQLMN